jgi:uncharacterized metal-binding protein/predicted Fe-Mo cluster-binding NifX family protein
MRYGIPITGERTAPRCIFADAVVVVDVRGNRARVEERVALCGQSVLDLAEVLSQYRIQTLICDGISRDESAFLTDRGVEIIDNVFGSIQELLEALKAGALRSGFGLASLGECSSRGELAVMSVAPAVIEQPKFMPIDCLACRDFRCTRGEGCVMALPELAPPVADEEEQHMLEATLDIAAEEEQNLCRLSELIYFCLEMRYSRIGVAYCADLRQTAEILVRVLRRYLKVHPVCCKVGEASSISLNSLKGKESRRVRSADCNPHVQAEMMNRIGTDMNVLVGLCMGADCIFTRFSKAPVTTFLVKDKSLANNPMGALYSGRYLKEAIQARQAALQRSHSDEP